VGRCARKGRLSIGRGSAENGDEAAQRVREREREREGGGEGKGEGGGRERE
jgi:hypothetical protein